MDNTFFNPFGTNNSGGGGGTDDTYTRAETDALLAEKADASNVYSKTQTATYCRDNLFVLSSAKNIAANTDLNSIRTVGTYATAAPQTILHRPETDAIGFRLYVGFDGNSSNNIEQIYNPYRSAKEWRRHSLGTEAWSDWVLVNDDLSNYPTAEEMAAVVDETTIHLDRSELCNFYRVLSDGTVDSAASFSVTSYINCKEVTTIELTGLIGFTSSGIYPCCAFYDENKDFISSIPVMRDDGKAKNKWEKEILQITVPDNAVYFRTTYVCMPNRYEYWLTDADDFYIEFKSKYYPNGKRPYQNGYIFFSQKVNQSVNQFWNTSNEVAHEAVYKPTTSVIALPESYTPDGKKTKVIMYFHGASHYVYYDHWGNTESFRTQKQHWIDMGFAVMDCNGARDNNQNGNFTSGGSMQYVDGYRKSWEYVKKNYNVDDYVYIVGGSAGGIPAINYCYWFNDCKALFLLSPWTDLYLCSWQQNVRDTIVEYLGFDDSTTYEQDKTVGFDPTLKIVTNNNTDYIYNSQLPPMKMIISTDESSSALYNPAVRYITALRNGGQNACVRYVSGLTHTEVVSGGTEFIDTEIGNWFLSI